MSFGDAVSSAFSKYATFSGRARRSEYWYFYLFNLLVSSCLSVGLNALNMDESLVTGITSLWGIFVMLPTMALICRRLHDIGKSGWAMLWVCLPLIGAIMLLIWECRDGNIGPNRYGPDPKRPDFVPGSNPWEY